MKDLEKQIEEAAKNFSNVFFEREMFVEGAKCEEAKAFHQQEMFTKEQVQDLIIKLFKSNLPYSDKIKWDVAIISEDNIRDFINKEVIKK